MPIRSASCSVSSTRCRVGSHRDAPMQQHALHPANQTILGDADPRLSCRDRKERRAVARLGRNRKVVATEKLPREREAVACGWADRTGQYRIDIGIAGQDGRGVREHQRIDPRLRPGAAQAPDQRRRQQHVTQPTQRHHQDARPCRQIEPRAHVSTAGRGAESRVASWRCNKTTPPATPTPNM